MTACPLCTHTNDNRQESSAVSASVPKKNVAHNTKSISFVVRTVGSSPAGKPKVRYNYQTLIYFQLVDHLFCDQVEQQETSYTENSGVSASNQAGGDAMSISAVSPVDIPTIVSSLPKESKMLVAGESDVLVPVAFAPVAADLQNVKTNNSEVCKTARTSFIVAPYLSHR